MVARDACDACGAAAPSRLAEFEGGRPTGRFLGPCCHPTMARLTVQEPANDFRKGVCTRCGRWYKRCECDA